MTRFRLLAVAVLSGALVAVVGVGEPQRAYGRAAQLLANGITVTGTGTVRSTPDRAQVSFGVQDSARTATAAFAQVAADMRKVIGALKDAGVASADIQTQQVSLEPRYTDNGEQIIGYIATNSVSAVLRDLDRAGAVIDAGVAAGANQVFGPSLSRSDQTELYRTALRAAVADARGKAQAIASAAGLSLGKVTAVEESGAAPPPPVPLAAAGAAPAPTPIEPGTQEIQASVVVSFAVA